MIETFERNLREEISCTRKTIVTRLMYNGLPGETGRRLPPYLGMRTTTSFDRIPYSLALRTHPTYYR